MPTKLPSLLLLIFLLSCKSTSLVSGYGVDKKDDFVSIAILPDTQYYTAMRFGGTMKMFENQIDWIIKNRQKEQIAYVIHLGDVTDRNTEPEWERAAGQLHQLDKHKIPYGVAVGNHDEAPYDKFIHGNPNTLYNRYFGKAHFKGQQWYGGQFGASSEDHFDLVDAKGQGLLVLYFGFNESNKKLAVHDTAYERKVLLWADSVISHHDDRKVILVSHSMLKRTKNTESHFKPGTGKNTEEPGFTKQGQRIYDMAKNHPNVFLMLGGHIAGESFRKDTYNGNTIKTYLSDYQSRQNPPYGGSKDRNGGNGKMRLMRLNLTKQTLSVISFAPQSDGSVVMEEDGDSQFTEPLFR